MLTDFDDFLAAIDPSLETLNHEFEAAPPVIEAYADVAPELLTIIESTTTAADTITEERRNLDALLLSAIGLADVGSDVVGGNRQAISAVAHLLAPTTDLTNAYHEALTCGLGGAAELAKAPERRSPAGCCCRRSSSDRNATATRPTSPRSPRPAARNAPTFRKCRSKRAPVRHHRCQRQPGAVRQRGDPAQLRRAQADVVRPDRRASRNSAQIGHPG